MFDVSRHKIIFKVFLGKWEYSTQQGKVVIDEI